MVNDMIFRCTVPGEKTFVSPEASALIVDRPGMPVPDGYGLYLCAEGVEIARENAFLLPKKCLAGSFVSVEAENGGPIIRVHAAADRADRTLFLTGRCNSNCIMCPYTEKFRSEAADTPMALLMQYVRLMDPYAGYLCITGGEPTLLREDFLRLLHLIKTHFRGTIVHILTNGRTFSYRSFLEDFQRVRPYNTVLGIPLHACQEALHDEITQSRGSFRQTLTALDQLSAAGEKIELRIVVSGLNYQALPDLARFIAERYPNVYHVCIMGLEMMGNAMLHRQSVWVPYDTIWPWVSAAVNLLLSRGIPVELFNFPLCRVEREFQPLYRRSITPGKIEYLPECTGCARQEECGGFFRTTIVMPGIRVHPFAGGDSLV